MNGQEDKKFTSPPHTVQIRDSGIELFRIITMLLIIAHHYVVNSGITFVANENPLHWRSLFLYVFGGFGKTGINCFVLITGYFMCKSHITAKKFTKLIFEVIFYKIVIYLIFLISGYETFTLSGLLTTVLPFTSIENNFTGCYLIFYLCIPFLNILVANMTEKHHILLLMLLGVVYVLLGTLPIFSIKMNYVTWFIVLYFVSSYVRLYPKKIFENKKIWGISALLAFIISASSIVICTWLGTKIGRQASFYFVSDSNKILAVMTGFCGFMFFKNIHFKSRFINTVAASTFGTLLIHANSDTMRRWLWKTVLNVPEAYGSQFLILHATGSVLVIFIICTVIDYIRICFIEKPLFDKLDGRFQKIDDYLKNKPKEENK